jgi:hypothetical protein
VGWDNGPLVATQLSVAPGDPNGVDTSSAGVLNLGGANATSVNIDPATTFDSTASVVGDFTAGGHILSTAAGTPGTSALGANVTSAIFTGNDTRGVITIVMAGALAANTAAFTATFAVTYGATSPKITLVDQTSAVGLTIVNSYVLSQSTGVSFVVAFDQALGAGTYIIDYIVIG